MCCGPNAQGQGTPAPGSWHKVLLPLIFLLWATEAATVVNGQALKGCDDHCGSLSIPYPFGTREGCYMNRNFLITCNHTYNPPLAFLVDGNINVTNIWLSGELRVYLYVAQDCYNKYGESTYHFTPSMQLSKFPISNTRNKFTTIGCDTSAMINGSRGTSYTTGCMSLCDTTEDVVEGTCSGIGCCQTAIPKGVMDYVINVTSYSNHTNVWSFNPCSYAFVAEEGTYKFSLHELQNIRKRNEKKPVVLNWAIGNQSCREAKNDHESFACKDNSDCHDSDNGPGYWCNCSKGFEGNPYLPHGCQGYNTNFNIHYYIGH